MIDKYFEWNIDGMQANAVLEGAEVNIPIDKFNYKDIIVNDKLYSFIKSTDSVLIDFFKCKDKNLTRELVDEFHLSYLIRNNKYYIGFDYNTIFNNILSKLRMHKRVKVENISSRKDYDDLISEVRREIAFQDHIKAYDGRYIPAEEKIISNLYDNIGFLLETMLLVEAEIKHYVDKQVSEEKVLRDNKKALSGIKNKHIEWKNLMFYTACKSLNIYEKTGDIRNYKYSKNYYLNVSRDMKCEYPSSMNIDNEFYDHQFTKFNSKFIKSQGKYFSSLDVRLGMEDIDTISGSLVPGDEDFAKNVGEGNSKKKVDYSKINEQLQRKIVFYKGLKGKVKGIMKKSLNADTNYYGFILDNNYIIYEKFYEVSKDGKKVSPAKDSAIYVVTIDVAVSCDFDSAKIRKYIAKNHDYKAFRLYHKDNDSYQKRINEVLNYHDCSTIKYKELKLLNEKNN